jgi:hypothetical protein
MSLPEPKTAQFDCHEAAYRPITGAAGGRCSLSGHASVSPMPLVVGAGTVEHFGLSRRYISDVTSSIS